MTGPEEWFESVASEHPRCFWLDGGGAREWSGRRSVIGHLADDDVSITFHAAAGEVRRHVGGRSTVVGDDVFEVLARELADGPSDAQWFGHLGYASRRDLPARPDPRLPDAVWMRPSVVRSFTHDVAPGPDSSPRPAEATATPPPVPDDYAAAFARVQAELHAGNTYEVNLTHRVTTRSPIRPALAYRRLRALNPAPYAGFLQHDVDEARAWLLSSSPERYALVTADRTCETKPIKGTTPRGATPEADEESRRRLASDPKFRAENLMIVDLLRNDLATVCAPGSVEVPALMQVESYASVHQLVSTVRGRLRDDVSTLQALRALFPAGSMTGAPKLRTMQVIDAVEATPRGAYAGAFGWLSADGRADLGVVIRSLMTAGDGEWTLGTGGGITVHSDVTDEWAEAAWKAERLLRVFDA
ncbi:anthranilate synthase component I family protein [Nocardioides jishulii]|uniref:Anthranilate synthase component I family protein n=1 Tax=Nocardioides jishulii TaxID=2575440 RepID=A0A4U2YRA5_9ACTN|nr:anthranilate synthase component I family protein [Nocardioides jishulii]QCX26257.1 anthranilate synthase component I family protein [Nocardioides jishulii]TKI63939.1 anthranilate synthase component I family protein [Nocardioides jishulii]